MPESGPTSERLEALRARWESDKGSRVFLQLADEYRRLGRTGDAVRVLEEGLAENPRYPAAQVALGRCHLETGRPAEAAEILERVVESDPTQMVAYRLLVDAYVAQGRPEEARQRLRVYSLLNDADPDIAELRRRIGQLERQGRPEAEPPAPPPAAPPEPEAGAGAEPAEDEARAAQEADPFPDLAEPSEGRRTEPEGDLFGLAPAPQPRIERPTADEPFDLDLTPPPSSPDLSSLLEGAPPDAPAEPEEPELVLGEAPPEDAPPPGAPSAEEPAPEDVPAPSPEPPTAAMATGAGEAPQADLPLPGRESDRPTVTLGLLYLRQGHTREAEEIFRAVLERDPDNAEALHHLEEIGERLRAELSEPPRLTAVDLLAGWEGEAGTTERKRYVLERYRDRLRGGAPRDVH